MRQIARTAVAACIFAGTFGSQAVANDLFQLNVTAPGVDELVVGGSSIINLTRDLIDTRNEFAPFAGTDFSASLRYAGVDNAILFTQSADGQTATVQLLGQPERTFTLNGGDLEDQIVDYLRGEGANDVRNFYKEINKRSIVAVMDGNPLATTARSAEYTFHRFGHFADLTAWERRQREADEPLEGTRGFRFRIDVAGGLIKTDVGDGYATALATSLGYQFNRRIAVVLAVPTHFHSIEGSNTFNVAAHLNVPIRILAPAEGRPLNWQITPGVLVAGAGSYDMVAGGLLYGGGITSALSYDITGQLTATLSNQITAYESVRLTYSDYEFHPGVSQQILKNGIKLTQGLGESYYIFGGITYTNFLQDAAIKDYWSPSVGGGLRTRRGTNFMLGYQADLGDGYTAHLARLSLQMPF